MRKFAFLLKTYEQDFPYAKRLLTSFGKYNRENIHCYVVAPEESGRAFFDVLAEEIKKNCSFISEEEWTTQLTYETIFGLKAGYINQEIIKLSFWEKGLCENYLCLDSDGVFIRDFYVSDFMYDADTPYSVLFEDNELKSDPYYYYSYWVKREGFLKRIQKELQFTDKKLLTCHGFQIFNRKVLEDFKTKYMESREYNYIDLMRISPYEFSWYNIWLQKSNVLPIHPCEQLFLYFHMKHQLYLSWILGRGMEDLKRSYVGIVINSNWTQGKDLSYFDKQERFRCGKWGIRQVIKMIKGSNGEER